MPSEREKALEAALREVDDMVDSVSWSANLNVDYIQTRIEEALAIPTDDKRSTSSAGDSEPVACKHEPFEGHCVHCGVRFVGGRAHPSPSISQAELAPISDDMVERYIAAYDAIPAQRHIGHRKVRVKAALEATLPAAPKGGA